jgi:hypothetical protein
MTPDERPTPALRSSVPQRPAAAAGHGEDTMSASAIEALLNHVRKETLQIAEECHAKLQSCHAAGGGWPVEIRDERATLALLNDNIAMRQYSEAVIEVTKECPELFHLLEKTWAARTAHVVATQDVRSWRWIPAYNALKAAADNLQSHLKSLFLQRLKLTSKRGTDNRVPEPLSLSARITAFMTDRANKVGRLPTLSELRKVFPGEIGHDATFYRNNRWYPTVRKGLKIVLRQRHAPTKGHRSTDGSSGDVDAALDAPDYHADEDD